ncbi:dihydrofolate reductase family protein [Spirillospora sp. CA-294931]|uniref:dihydrofolate reductase family protein n=1 Tax=Spirillospora sp. CA-294931 TaxID=3240042 RepID=UPI003D92B26C
MGKVVALVYVSMDGVMEAPEKWSLKFWNEQHSEYADGLLYTSGALLLGRATYETFAASWPHMEKAEGEFALRMNTLPKYVVSRSLDKAEWNNSTVVEGDLAEAVAKIKQSHEQNILIYGSGELVTSLIELGLVDELKLWVYPVSVGAGKRLFREGGPAASWTLATTTAFNSGAVVLDYRPAGEE